MPERLRHILEMIRFSHTVFAMPFAVLATIMAWCLPAPGSETVTLTWQACLGIVLCMVFARSAAMAFNRLVDRKIDAENPRTATRHLPAGILSVKSVILFTVICSIGFVASTLLFWPNWLPLALSVPVLAFLCGYSYTKRFTSLAHYWLGISLMLAPICAWVAIRGEVVLAHPADILPALMLGLGVLFWVAGFDIIYACQDAEFDRDAKLRSVPAKFGVPGALRIAAVSHFLAVLAFAALPFTASSLGIIYWIGLAAVAGLLLYEHALVRPNDLSKVNLAFFNVNTIIGIGVLAFTSIDLLWN
ncbi:UbiA-like polyprenyltransferase [Bremerella sp. P1]|uniref:UbiA-like polyprenyltransferase n=1 Tax=Bremerella sp. P1 TaxID=3026424 RepID=UPI0023678CC8|nr:UbiA-like polyprenyltransferase [Bremerella sp. P1]WDI43076.1 putative 4-hydroxybenzoate polyprenyltransferase [Bremerella sp. P1]